MSETFKGANNPSDVVGPLRVTTLKQTCLACPSQWKGMTEDGRQIYVRYRWGYLSIRVSEPREIGEFAAVRGQEIYGEQLNDGPHGFLSYEQLVAATHGVLQWPETLLVPTQD